MIARLRSERDKGFTLIELLVVLIIIGILAAVAVPVFLNQRKKAVKAQVLSDAHSVALSFDTYRTDHARYPDVVVNWHYIGEYQDAGASTAAAEGLMPQLSADTRIHAFDLAGYVPGFPFGQAYCIEIHHPSVGSRFYRSDKGGWISTTCQSA